MNLGFDSFFLLEGVIGFLDYQLRSVKRQVQSAKDTNPINVLNIGNGKKIQTAVWLVGNRFILTPIPRKQLARRIGFYDATPYSSSREEVQDN